MKIKAIRLKDKKGQSVLDIVIFAIICIVVVMFFGLWKFGFHIIATMLIATPTPADNPLNISISDSASKTFGNLDNGYSQLSVIGFCIIFGMILTIFISNFLVKANPVFFVAYFLVSLLAIIFAIAITMGYNEMINNSPAELVVQMQNDTANNFILSNLPTFVVIIAFIGAILLFAGINRDDGMGGGLS